MKFKKIYLLMTLVLLIVSFTNAIEAKAINTELSTEELSEEKKNTFVSNISISLLTSEPAKKGILCFDVNEHGEIAVGQTGSQRKTVCVYTSRGEFLYGYTFNCGQSFGVEWDEQNINIYFARSDVIISLDSNGNILEVEKVQNTLDNNKTVNSLLYSSRRTVGDTTYLIRNDMGVFNWVAASYSQIVTVDARGTEQIIYDINSTQLTNAIVISSFVCLLVIIAVVIIARQFKLKRAN